MIPNFCFSAFASCLFTYKYNSTVPLFYGCILFRYIYGLNARQCISEIPSPDEADVYRTLQDCLELRRSYVFKEAVAPWEKEIISDPSTPKRILNPFDHTPVGKSDVSWCNFVFFPLVYPKRLYALAVLYH